MKSYSKAWSVAAVLTSAALLTQYAPSATTRPTSPRGGGNPNPGVPSNCLSTNQVGNSNPGVHPPCSKPYGLAYGEWSAKWWEWVFSIPAPTNPQFQGIPASNPPAVVDCSVGQSGPVWFLAGDFGGIAARQCKDPIPSGVSIFFPVANNGFGVLGFDCYGTGVDALGKPVPNPRPTILANCLDPVWSVPDPTFPFPILSWSQLVAAVAAGFDPTPPISAEIDGHSLQNLGAYRAQAPMFSITIPDDSLLRFIPLPAGTYFPNGSDGFWVMLTPLSKGPHVVHFSIDGSLDVTYHFSVGPGH